jgi:hypothetical protein
MRIKNISGGLYARCFLAATFRDLQILGYCVLVNRKLLSSLGYVWKHRHETLAKRHEIQARRGLSDGELEFWFADHPSSRRVDASDAVPEQGGSLVPRVPVQ